MIEKGAIDRILASCLRPEGFRKMARTWYLESDESVVFVNLQRSQWSEIYYVNLGVLVKSIQNEPWPIRNRARPRAGEAHYEIRLEDLFSEQSASPAENAQQRARINALLDPGNPSLDMEQHEQTLRLAIKERAIPFLRLCRTEQGVRSAIMEILRSSKGTSGVLRDRLDIPIRIGGAISP